MCKELLSVGLDVGTSTTQMILSRLGIENRSSAFAVPDMHIAAREILYKSPVYFTPLRGQELVDGEKLRQIIENEYRSAGISRRQVDTGAIIITGETGRKENARTVLRHLSEFAGEFVVATAGPHLESVLAAKGAGADRYSAETGKCVVHIDIGGGTANFAYICEGEILQTGCMNVGGRLIKFDENGKISYRSPALDGIFPYSVGDSPPRESIESLCRTLAQALEEALGARTPTALLHSLWTREAGNVWRIPEKVDTLSFSGGVAACMVEPFDFGHFGDIGPTLAQAIRESRLCQTPYRVGVDAIRATVIGAGCHATTLSGSTVFHRGMDFPLKDLPVVRIRLDELSQDDAAEVLMQRLSLHEGSCAVALVGEAAMHYRELAALAEKLARVSIHGARIFALEQDMAKSLGQALALRLPKDTPILCIDRVRLPPESFLDVGEPIGDVFPVVIKTLILEK